MFNDHFRETIEDKAREFSDKYDRPVIGVSIYFRHEPLFSSKDEHTTRKESEEEPSIPEYAVGAVYFVNGKRRLFSMNALRNALSRC